MYSCVGWPDIYCMYFWNHINGSVLNEGVFAEFKFLTLISSYLSAETVS